MLLSRRLKAVSQTAPGSRRQPSGLPSFSRLVRPKHRSLSYAPFAAPKKGGLLLMNGRVLCVAGALAASIAAAACSLERSSDPLTPTIAGPVPGVVISAPKTMQPPNGAKVGADKP